MAQGWIDLCMVRRMVATTTIYKVLWSQRSKPTQAWHVFVQPEAENVFTYSVVDSPNLFFAVSRHFTPVLSITRLEPPPSQVVRKLFFLRDICRKLDLIH